MKVIFLTTSYPRFDEDDTSVFLEYFATSLNSSDVEVEVVAPHDSSVKSPKRQVRPITINRFGYGIFQSGKLAYGAGLMVNLRNFPLRVFQLPMLCIRMFQVGFRASSDANLIHAHWIIAAGVGAVIARIRRIPLVVTIHGSEMLLLKSRLFAFLVGRILAQADSIVTVSKGFKETLEEHFPQLAPKISHIPFGTDHFSNYKDVKLPPELETALKGNISFLAVGTLCPRKNQEALLLFLTEVGLSNASLILCGKTDDHVYLERIKSRARELGVSDRVSIVGPQPAQVVAALLKRCSLFVSASTFEGRPVALLEALASGCLTLVSKIPAHEEVIQEAKNGYLFDLRDMSQYSIANKILDSKNNSSVRENALDSMRDLSWTLCSKEYKKVYLSLKPDKASG